MKKVIIILIFALFIFSQPVHAHVFRLNTDKTIYEPGDEIIVNLEVKNTLSVKKDFDIYVRIEERNGKYPPSCIHYFINLLPGESKNITVYNTTVSEYLVNGNYVIHAQLWEDGFAIYEDEIGFSITGLPETMNIEILLSNSSSFSFLKDVFVLNEKIYIGYYSSIDDLNVSCNITYPDGSSNNVILPYNFNAKQTGIYSLHITAHKEGYRDFSKSLEFAVIEKIPFQEISPPAEFPIIYIGIIIVIIVVAIILLFFFFRGRHE